MTPVIAAKRAVDLAEGHDVKLSELLEANQRDLRSNRTETSAKR